MDLVLDPFEVPGLRAGDESRRHADGNCSSYASMRGASPASEQLQTHGVREPGLETAEGSVRDAVCWGTAPQRSPPLTW